MLSEYWKNYGQNWAKSKLDFLLYELLHEQIRDFFSLKFILPRPKQNRGRIFILFKYFLNNLFLIVFVQNMISKFVKVLPQLLNNSLLEKSRTHFCAAVCENCVCEENSKSLSVHHTEIFY